MTKAEILSDIIYDLRMKGSADFEADEESYSVSEFTNGKGYVIESKDRYIEAQNITEVKKVIRSLGKNLLWL